jgi:hypothetical protein
MIPRLPIDEPLFQVDQLFRVGRGYDANANGYALWHWQDDQGQLRPYSLQDSRAIEQAWQQHEEEVQLVISGRHYLLDLQQLMKNLIRHVLLNVLLHQIHLMLLNQHHHHLLFLPMNRQILHHLKQQQRYIIQMMFVQSS